MPFGLIKKFVGPRLRFLDEGPYRLVRPVILSGFAVALLFAATDRNEPWSMVSASLGVALLGMVLTRQLGQIVSLEARVEQGLRRLSVVSEVVSALNSSANVGTTLSLAFERLTGALDADGGAIWLPSPQDDRRLSLVEHRNLPAPERSEELLAEIRRATGDSSEDAPLRHSAPLSNPAGEKCSVNCLTVAMSRDGQEFGYLTVFKRRGVFNDADGEILSAVGTDIGNALRSVRLLSEARRLADKDPVTGLQNHRSAYQRLHAELKRHAAEDAPLAVLMMDLDNFKLFNDTYGHPAGDEVLKRVSGIIRRCCRDEDTVARYGGDEFMVLLPRTELKTALKCAERIQTALGRERFRCQDSATLPIGFSYGVAVFPDDGREAQDLVSAADTHLYQSKANGGNRITARGEVTVESALSNLSSFDLFRAMVVAIDNKDGYTRQHSEEVTEYSLEIARAMGLSADDLETIRVSGILHDVGKIGVPDSILRKPGKLTDEEFEVMRQHPAFGALIVGAIPGMEEVVLGVRHHHERYDGRGYPDRLAGTNIPLIGRIMAVADAYSAMTTIRPYRKALTQRQALAEIRKNLGTQFDPEIGELFIRLREGRETGGETEAPRRTSRRKPPVPAEPELAAANGHSIGA